jgi:hypothetical protein
VLKAAVGAKQQTTQTTRRSRSSTYTFDDVFKRRERICQQSPTHWYHRIDLKTDRERKEKVRPLPWKKQEFLKTAIKEMKRWNNYTYQIRVGIPYCYCRQKGWNIK